MTFAQISNIIVLQNIFKCAHVILVDFLMINAHCIIFCFGEDFKMKKNRLNSNLPSVIELNGLLSKIGADSNLAKIRQYVSYRSNYLIPNKKFKLQDHSEAMLYRYMTDIEPDVFFDVYLPGYFAFVSPF